MRAPRIILAVFFCCCAAFGGELPLSSGNRILVLRNGFVLTGQVTPLGDHFLVSNGESDQVRISADRVEMVCGDIQEAYRRKRDAVATGDVRGHLLLADWCLRHELHARASDQILAAVAWDPGQPLIRALKARLIAAASYQESAKGRPVAEDVSESSRPNAVSPVSAVALHEFASSVQPLLINRCAAGACHASNRTSDFHLMRPPVGQLVTSRLSQRNLRAVLKYVDRQAPARSRLLTVARGTHGGLREPVISENELAVTQTLTEWFELVREAPAQALPSALTSDPQTLLQTEPGEFEAEEAAQPAPTSDGFVPRDAFDPEIFNRAP